METNNTKWFSRYGTEITRKVHQINENTAEYTYQDRCSRCGGAGGSEAWRYTGWTCYDCGGSGLGNVRTEKVYTAEKLAKLNAAQEKRDAKKAEKLAAEQAEKAAAQKIWREAHAEALALMESTKDGNPFLMDLINKAEYYPLTDRQLEAGVAAANRVIERKKQNEMKTWIGTVGERIEFSWTTDKVIELQPTQFGYRMVINYLVLGHDENGNSLKYIGNTYAWPKVGDTVSCKATIKDHSEYNGLKQTVISRPKFGSVDDEQNVEAMSV